MTRSRISATTNRIISSHPTISSIPSTNQTRPQPRKKQGRYASKNRTRNGGRKPAYLKYLGRASAGEILQGINDKTAWAECYQLAKSATDEKGNAKPDVRAMVEILRYLTDRRDGRSFIATNPDALPPAPGNQDNRLQVAIQNLILPAAKKKSFKTLDPANRKRLAANRERPIGTITSDKVPAQRTPLTLAESTGDGTSDASLNVPAAPVEVATLSKQPRESTTP